MGVRIRCARLPWSHLLQVPSFPLLPSPTRNAPPNPRNALLPPSLIPCATWHKPSGWCRIGIPPGWASRGLCTDPVCSWTTVEGWDKGTCTSSIGSLDWAAHYYRELFNTRVSATLPLLFTKINEECTAWSERKKYFSCDFYGQLEMESQGTIRKVF